jgi:hypothetical protein
MSSVLRAVWDNTYGLLVDDGQLAIGAIAALAITWLAAQTGGVGLREDAGWLLLAMVLLLAVTNIYRAGQNARRKHLHDRPGI